VKRGPVGPEVSSLLIFGSSPQGAFIPFGGGTGTEGLRGRGSEMFAFLSQGVIGEILAPVKSPGQLLHAAIEDQLNDKVSALEATRARLFDCQWVAIASSL
jgi:hypothetical protein